MKLTTKTRRGTQGGRRGSALVYLTVALVALTGICSLAVDWGRVQLVKGELQMAVDAAARHAAPSVGRGAGAVRGRAKGVASENRANGTPVVLSDADIEEGNWSASTRVFVPNGSPANAVRVTASRSGATAVPLLFGRLFGRETFDVRASAIVVFNGPLGFVGLNGITFHNNAFVGSYKPSTTKNPTHGLSTGKALLSSNGPITAHKHVDVHGNVTLGPSGAADGVDVTGTITRTASAITPPAMPAWSPGINPLNLPQNYAVNSKTTLPGGTYWFTSWHVNQSVSFSGPAVVHVNGNITIDKDSITAHNSVPANLQIYQLGANRTFVCNNNSNITAQVFAPGSSFTAHNQLDLRGGAFFRTMDFHNNTNLYLDVESAGGGGGAPGPRMVR